MKHKIEFASHPANLSMVRGAVRQFVKGSELSIKEIELIVLGVDEACTNIIRHVYKHEETHLIELVCETVDKGVCFRLRDYGAHPADPNKIEGRSLEVVRPGGLGMHLIRTAFDQVDFNMQKVGTELVLTKHFTDHAQAELKNATTG